MDTLHKGDNVDDDDDDNNNNNNNTVAPYKDRNNLPEMIWPKLL
jgi:hypothetical protein